MVWRAWSFRSFGTKASLRALHIFLKVFSELGIPGLASFIYHPSAKVAPLPLLSLLGKIKTVVASSV